MGTIRSLYIGTQPPLLDTNSDHLLRRRTNPSKLQIIKENESEEEFYYVLRIGSRSPIRGPKSQSNTDKAELQGLGPSCMRVVGWEQGCQEASKALRTVSRCLRPWMRLAKMV